MPKEEYIETSKHGFAKVGGPTHKKGILNRTIHTAGKQKFLNLDTERFIAPTGRYNTVSKLEKKIKSEGKTIEGHIFADADYTQASSIVARRAGKFSIANFELKPDRKDLYINHNHPNEAPSFIDRFYKQANISKILLFNKKDITENKTTEKKNIYINLKFVLDYVDSDLHRITDMQFRWVKFNSLEQFKRAIIKLTRTRPRGATPNGSDIDLYKYDLDPNFFQVFYLRKNPEGGSYNKTSHKSKYYFNENISSKNNNCCLAAIKLFTGDKRRVDTMRKSLIKYLSDQDIEMKIDDMISIDLMPHIEKWCGKSIGVLTDDSLNDYIYTSKTKKNIRPDIRLLLKDKHYTLITQDKKQPITKAEKEKKKILKNLYLTFDCETVVDKTDVDFLKPYACAWCVYKNPLEFIPSKEDLKKANYETGDDCIKKLIKFILACPEGYRYIIIGFNNSKFDNFFLADELMKNDITPDIFFVNNAILKMTFNGHMTFDVRRYLSPDCPLKKCAESFATHYKKVDGFDHNIPQKAFNEGRLPKWIKDNNKKLEEYNKMDVLCTWDLTVKLNKAVNDMTGKQIFDNMTIGSFAWDYFCELTKTKFKKKSSEVFPRAPDIEIDKFIRESITAGRTQAYFGPQRFKKGEMKFKMVDATSLYPYSMIDHEYPIGEMIKTSKFMEKKLGIYKCTIKHQKAKWLNGKPEFKDGLEKYTSKHAPTIFPKRHKDKSVALDWTYRGEMKVTLCSVDINEIKKYCGDDSIIIHNGYYWKESSKNLFNDFMLPFKNMKIKQDSYKDSKSDKYNPALREFCKLIQNSLSGKVIQRNFRDIIKAVRNEKDIEKFEKKVGTDYVLFSHSAGTTFLKGKLSEEDSYKSSAKPAYLGIFIYAYARKYMYETVLSRYITFYQDTDSALMPKYEYDRFKKEQPESHGSAYGCFKEELGDCDEIIIIAPKNYLVIAKDETKSKRKFKGIKKSDTYMLIEDLPEDFNKNNPKHVSKMLKTANKCLSNQMFIDHFKGKEYIVFTSQLRRIVDYMHKDDLSKGKIGIKQIYTTKTFNSKTE